MSLIAGVQGRDFVLLGADLRHWGNRTQVADLGGKLTYTPNGWACTSAGQAPARVAMVAMHVAAGTSDGSPEAFFTVYAREFGAALQAMTNGTGPQSREEAGDEPMVAAWENGDPQLAHLDPDGTIIRWPEGFVGFAHNDEDPVEKHEARVAAADGLGEAVKRLAAAFADVGSSQPRVSESAVIAALWLGDGTPTRCSWTGRASELAGRSPRGLLASANPFGGQTR